MRVTVPFVLAAASALFAQNPDKLAPLIERIEVSVTNVDVVVTDSAGHPVNGLPRDEFEIFEDGKPQIVTNFYAIQDATVSLATRGDDSEGSIDPDQFRRKIVLLIDNNFIQKPNRDAALSHLDAFVDSHATANCQWTLVAIGRRAVTTLQPFTSSRSEMHAAIMRARRLPVFDEQRQLDREILSDPVRRSGRLDSGSGSDDFGQAVRFRAREQTRRNLDATLGTARAVIQTCRAFGSAEGKKVIVLVTGGMEMNTSFQAYDTQDDRVLTDMKLEIAQALDTIVREANATNVNVYVVNARNRSNQAPQHDVSNKSSGVNPGAGSLQDAMGSGPIDVTDIDSSSRLLAAGTGGLYLPANNVARAFQRIDDDTSNYYSLGFSPQHGDDGVYHHIKVRVKHGGLQIRYREGFRNTSVNERLEQSLLSPLTFPKDHGALPVKLVVGIPDSKDRELVVPVTAEMPMNLLTIVPHDGDYAGRVHIYLSIYDADGNNVGYHHFVQELSVDRNDYSCLATASFRYHTTVGLKPGLFTILVTLRDDITNEIGMAVHNVKL